MVTGTMIKNHNTSLVKYLENTQKKIKYNNNNNSRRQLTANSLWEVNKEEKNLIMWKAAVKYIESKLQLKFSNIYNYYINKERRNCMEQTDSKCALNEHCQKRD